MVELTEKVETLEAFDGYAELRNGLRVIASEKGEWAGIPMPLDDIRIIIEPTYARGASLAALGKKPDPTTAEEEGCVFRSTFYSSRYRCDVVIWHEPDGKLHWGLLPAYHALQQQVTTLGASRAWGLEQEANAMQLFATLVDHHQMRQYLLTGSFLERSPRSGLTYMFRKLRPTVVLDARPDGKEDTHVLCALCMHPIAYYQDSWAGAMCPTDDVIAHLMLMRGDEHMFWKRSNQHPPHRPEAGL